MTPRKAFLLIELVGMFAVLALVLVVSAPLMNALISEAPRFARDIWTARNIEQVLAELQRDLDQAVSLPEAVGGRKAGTDCLLIEMKGRVVCYEHKDGAVVRRIVSDGEGGGSPTTWKVPKARIEWIPWQRDGVTRTVVVHTCIERDVQGRRERKLQTTRVFFLGAAKKSGKAG